MTLKKGDQIKMLAGKDRGKTGIVLSAREGKVVVEGLNLVKKRKRPTQQGKTGETILLPRAVDASNAALICKNCKKATRVGFRSEGSLKIRYCKKCEAPN
jgi:large subunit ribosomal protein L24